MSKERQGVWESRSNDLSKAMGKTKIQVIGSTDASKEKKKSSPAGGKKSLKKEKGIRVSGLKGGARVVAVSGEAPETEEHKTTPSTDSKKSTQIKKKKVRGKKYLASLAKIEPNKLYGFSEAVKLVKETSWVNFDGNVRLSLVFAKKNAKGDKLSMELPYSTGVKKKIEIANEATLEKIKQGKIDFDVLLATPAEMPKLVPFAKILGPKGLMPNPKNGTLVANPEAEIAKFSANSLQIKLPKDSNSASVVIGKTSQTDAEIAANLETVVGSLTGRGVKKAVVSATMGPGIKIQVN